MICSEIMALLEEISPKQYALEWDNVGLLVGRRDRDIKRLVVALDATDEVIDYAIEIKADMIVTHHPMIFGKIRKVNDEDFIGKRILRLMENGINCYAMHTNFDVKGGMAQLAAKYLHMTDEKILEVTYERDGITEGIGRYADYEELSVRDWAERVKKVFGLSNVTVYGDANRRVTRVAISPGSGKSMIEEAGKKGVELLITGDIGHHEGIDATACGISIIDATHYGLEKIFIPYIADYLKEKAKETDVVIKETGVPQIIL